jgi:N-acetyltransferase 10
VDQENPFELFVSSTEIRYNYYKESDKILGQTFGMLVLQDFEAVTPNLLAKTIETVQGGGIVVLLLKTMQSLKQLYAMTMDVHSRYTSLCFEKIGIELNLIKKWLLDLMRDLFFL